MLSNESNQTYSDTRHKTQDARHRTQETGLQMKENFLHLLLYLSVFEGKNVNMDRNGESTGRQAASVAVCSINEMVWLMGLGFTPCGENLPLRFDA